MESKNKLNSLLEAKLALLKSYDLLTERSKESFRLMELDNLRGHLSRREELIQKIEALDSSLREMLSARKDERPETVEKIKGMLETYHSQMKRVLEQIALKENDLIPNIRGEREQLKKEIIRMRETRHAVVRYHNPNPFSPRFLDARK